MWKRVKSKILYPEISNFKGVGKEKKRYKERTDNEKMSKPRWIKRSFKRGRGEEKQCESFYKTLRE